MMFRHGWKIDIPGSSGLLDSVRTPCGGCLADNKNVVVQHAFIWKRMTTTGEYVRT